MSRRTEKARAAGGVPVMVEGGTKSREAGFIVAVTTGSRDEVPEVCGISRLLKRIVNKHTKARRPRQNGTSAKALGWDVSGCTARESTESIGLCPIGSSSSIRNHISDLVDGSLDSIEDQMERGEAVTEDDVMRVAEQTIRPGLPNVAAPGIAGSLLRSMRISDFGF